MTSRSWAGARLSGGVLIIAALLWRLGTGPFRDAVGVIDGWSLAAAAGISVMTTVACAWRWSLVARGLGVAVPLPWAIASCYRSQFLNTTLPGGVLGDVHRAVSHGRDVGDVGRGLRAVAWERSAGQVVQIGLATATLLLMPSPLRSSMPAVASALVVVAAVAILLARGLPQQGQSRAARVCRAVVQDVRNGLLARGAWPGVLLASVVVVLCQATLFVVAARTAGSDAPVGRLVPLAMLVLLAMTVPFNVAGWGPREGAAAWAFGLAGLSAGQGVTTAVVYGVMVTVASLPGAGVLLVGWLRRGVAPVVRTDPAGWDRSLSPAVEDGVSHG